MSWYQTGDKCFHIFSIHFFYKTTNYLPGCLEEEDFLQNLEQTLK